MSCHLSLVLHKNSQPKLKHIVVLFFLPLFCTRAYTQTDSTKSVQQTILRAQQKTANFDFATAEELLQKALKIEPESIDVRLALGKLAIKKYDWRAANNHFEKVLERDAENLEAHYYRAICYREIGKFRPEFLRKMPLIGGLLAAVGYNFLFAAAAGFGILALLIMISVVNEPRRKTEFGPVSAD